ncbi:MAG: hypothetical protein AAF569_06930 [Pseudomonadota bacterium]
MSSDLSSESLARLHTKLVVPFAVGDLIKTNSEIKADIQYALHEALSEMDPDTALLAIAVSTGHIAARLCPDVPVACALTVEAEKVLNEYGADWLAHSDGRMPSREGDDLFNVLQHVPEDLEALADILDTLMGVLDDSQQTIKDICYILSVQARAHMEIAEFVVQELQGRDIQNAPHIRTTETEAENIIIFPGTIH